MVFKLLRQGRALDEADCDESSQATIQLIWGKPVIVQPHDMETWSKALLLAPSARKRLQLKIWSCDWPHPTRGFAKGVSRTVSPRFFSENETEKKNGKKRKKTEKNGKKRNKRKTTEKNGRKQKENTEKTEENGRKRKKTEKIGSDTVPATPFAKLRPTQDLPSPSGPAPRKSPKRVRKEYPGPGPQKSPKESAPESQKSPKRG